MTTSATVIDRERTNTKGPRDPRTMWRSSGPESWVNRNWDHWAFSRWYTRRSRRMQSSFVRLDIAQKIAISPAASRNWAYWSQPSYTESSNADHRYVYFDCLNASIIVIILCAIQFDNDILDIVWVSQNLKLQIVPSNFFLFSLLFYLLFPISLNLRVLNYKFNTRPRLRLLNAVQMQ